VIALVCGGRDFTDAVWLCRVLDQLRPAKVIAGGAPGADALAVAWAMDRGVDFREYVADWETHGRAAGPIRNQLMLEDGRPDLVVAFPGGRGTADMVRKARTAGVPVLKQEAR